MAVMLLVFMELWIQLSWSQRYTKNTQELRKGSSHMGRDTHTVLSTYMALDY